MAKKKQFSFQRDGPFVKELYEKENLSVSQIAKQLGRGYNTIKNYLEHEGIYRGPASTKKKSASIAKGKTPDKHVQNEIYFSTRHQTIAKFCAYYKDACRIWLPDPAFLHYAYCKPTELINMKEEK